MSRRMARHALACATALLPLIAEALPGDASGPHFDSEIEATIRSAKSAAGLQQEGLVTTPCPLPASLYLTTGDDRRRYGPAVAHGHAGLQRTSRHPEERQP